jgi:hypothetical protein
MSMDTDPRPTLTPEEEAEMAAILAELQQFYEHWLTIAERIRRLRENLAREWAVPS